MPNPTNWNNQNNKRSAMPDLVSQDLQRKSLAVVLTSVIGLVAAVITLILAGPQGGLIWLGFAVLGVAVLFFLLRYFELGLVAFLGVCWIAAGSPTLAEGGSGGGSQQLKISQMGLLVLLTLWGMRRVFQTRRGGGEGLYRAPVYVPILLYLAFGVWATLNAFLFPNDNVLANGPKQFVQVNIIEILFRVLALGGLVMVANTLKGRALKAASVAVLLPGVLSFIGVFKQKSHSTYLEFPQTLVMAVCAAIALTADWAKPWQRVACGLFALWIVYVRFITNAEWVSGWLGAFVALGLIAFLSRRKLFFIAVAVIAVIVALDFPYFYDKIYASNFYGAGTTHDIARIGHMGTFTNDRTRMLAASFRYATSFPLGIGLGNYRAYNMYFGRVDVWNTTAFTSAHGTYAQALSETGFPGLLTLLLLLYTCGRMLKKYYGALPDNWTKTYVLGVWGGCIGVFCAAFIGDYLFPTYHNGGMGTFGATVYTWLMIGVAIAIAREQGLEWSELVPSAAAAKMRRVVAPVYRHGPHALPAREDAPTA